MLRERSLKSKLIIRNTTTLSAVYVAFLVMLILLNWSHYKSQIESQKIELTKNLENKGKILVDDKDIMFPDDLAFNRWTKIQEVIFKNMETSKEIDYGGLIQLDYRPWAWIGRDEMGAPKATVINRAEPDQIINETTEWMVLLREEGKRILEPREGQEYQIFEYAVPIWLDEEDTDTEGMEEVVQNEDGQILAGVLVYGLSTAINDASLENSKATFLSRLKQIILLMIVLGLFGLGFAIFVSQRQASTITQPLESLTGAADTITEGDYNIAHYVDRIRSGDELQVLAVSFGQMATEIFTRDDELKARNRELTDARNKLEDLNRHLEDKVEERTKQLKESESKFRTLFEESADAILVLSEDRFLDCNPAMLHMMGVRTKEEFLAMSPSEIMPEYQPDGTRSLDGLNNFFQLARSQGSQNQEWYNRRINGEEFPTEIVITSFPLNGERVLHMVLRDITERKKTEDQLKITQQKLVETAHSAGMAEIATGVLHNIGNILNSVNISTEEISGTLKSSKLKGFLKANEIVSQNMDEIGDFFTVHPKGKLIPGYFLSLGDAMKEEHRIMNEEIIALADKVSMMRDVISTQQNYAKATLYTENVAITDIIEDALKLQMAALKKQGVRIVRKFTTEPRGSVPKVKLVHVLTNLVKNSKEAMFDNEKHNKQQELVIELLEREEGVEVRISDNGCGIREDNLEKIFNHGFTTKDEGHGFGLHTCANFMTEMGGSLVAESEGEGEGSTFVVRFPLVCRGPKQVDSMGEYSFAPGEGAN